MVENEGSGGGALFFGGNNKLLVLPVTASTDGGDGLRGATSSTPRGAHLLPRAQICGSAGRGLDGRSCPSHVRRRASAASGGSSRHSAAVHGGGGLAMLRWLRAGRVAAVRGRGRLVGLLPCAAAEDGGAAVTVAVHGMGSSSCQRWLLADARGSAMVVEPGWFWARSWLHGGAAVRGHCRPSGEGFALELGKKMLSKVSAVCVLQAKCGLQAKTLADIVCRRRWRRHPWVSFSPLGASSWSLLPAIHAVSG
ncbi:unnamed protein product [Urochloa humidicola]